MSILQRCAVSNERLISNEPRPTTLKNPLVIAWLCALAAWMPVANAQLHGRHEARSGVLEFEANGYPTDQTVGRIQDEIDYLRAVQAYIHLLPAIGFMQWRNAHDLTRLLPGELNAERHDTGATPAHERHDQFPHRALGVRGGLPD
ncbi:MAG: hypothetical protein NTU56_07215 [Proteobacteria bacterium]|nr:hypothetical protein [Pseudomonadota bacterium]